MPKESPVQCIDTKSRQDILNNLNKYKVVDLKKTLIEYKKDEVIELLLDLQTITEKTSRLDIKKPFITRKGVRRFDPAKMAREYFGDKTPIFYIASITINNHENKILPYIPIELCLFKDGTGDNRDTVNMKVKCLFDTGAQLI